MYQEAEVIKDILKEAEGRMKGAIQSLESDLAVIRTGRANPALVEKLSVSYYDTPTPLLQLASISVPEPRSILIKPFDPSTLKDVERAILGLRPGPDTQQRWQVHPPQPASAERRTPARACKGG